MSEQGKRALITGLTGQDGAYLAEFLLRKGYRVYGTYRRLSTPNVWRLQHLGILDRVQLVSADLIDLSSLHEALRIAQPVEVYHLAAQSFVGASFEQPIGAGETTGLGVVRMLEAIRQVDTNIRFYQASTSELFGGSNATPQHELTPFHPSSPYAAAKLYGHWATRIYREGYGLFACNGILFNHESPIRGLEFVTRKISNTVAKIALGLESELVLGYLDARRDWGYAPDYVGAMWSMLQQDKPSDYVIATGESHSVREFAQLAFQRAHLDWERYTRTDASFLRPLDVPHLQGDSSRARNDLAWSPSVRFTELVQLMVDADLARWQRWLNGERFPWDAPSYPSESQVLSRSGKVNKQ